MNINNEASKEKIIEEWPVAGREHVKRCPACGCKERKQLYSDLTDLSFRCAPGRWDLYLCKKCRSAYLDSRPTRETISLAYQQYYTHEKSKRQATAALPWWRRYIRALANGYRNRRYGGELKPESILGPWLIPLLPRLRLTLDRELRYLPIYKPGLRLLDVGFGSGRFLVLAKRIGWQVSGVDPDPVAVHNALNAGLDVRQGDIKAFADSNRQFDVITLSHVIEHVHDPVETLKLAHALLKPGGVIYIDTPNIDAYGHHDFKEHWRGLEIPRHLVIFNWFSIKQCLNNAGFEVIKEIYSFSNYGSLARASRGIRDGKSPYSIKAKKWRDRFKEFRLCFLPFSEKSQSEFITLYAKKPVSV